MSQEIAKKEKNITDKVLAKVNSMSAAGAIILPKDYKVGNALKSAYLIISETKDKSGKTAFETCTQPSIATALLKMVVGGLNPYSHGAFIIYGKTLTFQTEYFADIFIAKRDANVISVNAQAIYKDDIFDFEVSGSGIKKIIEHKQTLASLSGEVIGAYAVAIFNDGSQKTEIMNIAQIKKSWNMGYAKGNSKAHLNFGDEMAKKTVIRRLLKPLVKSVVESASFEDNTPKLETKKQEIDLDNQEFETIQNTEAIEIKEVKEIKEVAESNPEQETATKPPFED